MTTALKISEGWAIPCLSFDALDAEIASIASEIAGARESGEVQHAGVVFHEQLPLDRPLWNIEEFAAFAERLVAQGLCAELDVWFAESRTIPPQPMLDALGVWTVANGRRLRKSEFLGPLRTLQPSDAVMRWFMADMAQAKGSYAREA